MVTLPEGQEGAGGEGQIILPLVFSAASTFTRAPFVGTALAVMIRGDGAIRCLRASSCVCERMCWLLR